MESRDTVPARDHAQPPTVTEEYPRRATPTSPDRDRDRPAANVSSPAAAAPHSSQPKESQGSSKQKSEPLASGSQENKPSQPETTGSKNTRPSSPPPSLPPILDPERSAPNDPRAYCLLEIVSSPSQTHECPLVDIIAIQDQDEPREEAWIYDFDKVALRSRAAAAAAAATAATSAAAVTAAAAAAAPVRSTGQGSAKSGSAGGGGRDCGKGSQGAAAELGTTKVGPWREGVAMVPPGEMFDAGAREAAIADVQTVPERVLPDTASLRPPSVALRRGSVQPVEYTRAAAAAVAAGAGAAVATTLLSLPPATEPSLIAKNTINWLQHPKMLPAAIPGARIMTFSYPSYQLYANTTLTICDFLERISGELYLQIQRARAGEEYESPVSVLFVACGFGALVLQSAVSHPVGGGLASLRFPAGVVFIDAPYPSLGGAFNGVSGAKRKPPPVIYGSVRMRRISEFVYDGQEGPVDCARLWNDFDVERMKSGHDMPIVWFYNKSKTNKKPPDNELRGVTFRGLATDRRQEMDRYWAFEDPNYREVLAYLQRFLLFEAASQERLEHLLDHLIEAQFPVDAADESGLSALHIAASVPNPTAVAILANRAGVGVVSGDSRGQTPLHKVIIRAAEVRPTDDAARAPFKDVIQRILRRTLKVDTLDDALRTAWDYAHGPGFSWIRELKAHRDMIQGPSITATTAPLDLLRQPGEDQMDAVLAFEAIVAEFFLEKREMERHEFINYETPTIYDLIYTPRKGPERILALSRPRGFKARSRCQWIHIPANNEQWIHDLFLKLRIKDSSMASERHQGSRSFSRWLYPQAKRYKHAHEKRPRKQKRPTLKRIASSALPPTSDSEGSNIASQMSKRATSQADIPLGLPIAALSDTDITPDGPPSARTWVPAQPKFGNIITDMDAIVLFMPVLGFETNSQRRAMSSVIHYVDRGYIPHLTLARHRALPRNSDTDLLIGYLKHDRPVHCRRTLDQFSYYMLETTERRDKDQVAYKWGRKDPKLPKAERPILMVDQLWLWALHNGTVITSFPNTFNPKRNKEFDLRTIVEMELAQNKTRRPIRSAEELVYLIIKMGVDFFDRTGPGGFKFQECFQSSINDIVEEQAKLLKGFRRLTRVLNKDVDTKTRAKLVEELFQLHAETRLLTEIMDIQDELNIVRAVLTQQKDVLDKLLKIVQRPEEERERSDLSEKSGQSAGNGADHAGGGENRKAQFYDNGDLGSGSGRLRDGDSNRRENSKRDHSAPPVLSRNVTVLRSKGLVMANIGIIDDNITIVGEMLAYARNVQQEINSLLDLKQKQANAWEARFSREGSEQTMRQGNIMFVFTIVTIVFLPLSFIASLMSVPVSEYPRYQPNGDEMGWPLKTAYTWIFGVGTAILVPLMVLAIGVNHIAKFTETHMARPLRLKRRGSRPSSSDNGNPSEVSSHDDNSDDSSSVDGLSHPSKDGKKTTKGSSQAVRSRAGSRGSGSGTENSLGREGSSAAEIDPDYALLLGRWKFHVRIPLLRRLWRYTASVPLSDDFSAESFRVYDYPFHRWVERPLGRLAIKAGTEQWWVWVVGGEDYLAEVPAEQVKGWWRKWRSKKGNVQGEFVVMTQPARGDGGLEQEAGKEAISLESDNIEGMGAGGRARTAETGTGESWMEDGRESGDEMSPDASPETDNGEAVFPRRQQDLRRRDDENVEMRQRQRQQETPSAGVQATGTGQQEERAYTVGSTRLRVARRRYIDVVSSDEDGIAFGKRVR